MLGGGGDEVSNLPVVFPRGAVSVSSLNYFSYVGSYSKPSYYCLTLSLSEHTIFKSISRIKGGGIKDVSMHRMRRPGMRNGGRKCG